jgi:hypothetical protein
VRGGSYGTGIIGRPCAEEETSIAATSAAQAATFRRLMRLHRSSILQSASISLLIKKRIGNMLENLYGESAMLAFGLAMIRNALG